MHKGPTWPHTLSESREKPSITTPGVGQHAGIAMAQNEMTTKISAALMAAFLCIPLLAHAQAYKCKQPDGSLGFQDHPCQVGAAGTAIALPPIQGYAPARLGQIGSALMPRRNRRKPTTRR
jgi:hypothetical protein